MIRPGSAGIRVSIRRRETVPASQRGSLQGTPRPSNAAPTGRAHHRRQRMCPLGPRTSGDPTYEPPRPQGPSCVFLPQGRSSAPQRRSGPRGQAVVRQAPPAPAVRASILGARWEEGGRGNRRATAGLARLGPNETDWARAPPHSPVGDPPAEESLGPPASAAFGSPRVRPPPARNLGMCVTLPGAVQIPGRCRVRGSAISQLQHSPAGFSARPWRGSEPKGRAAARQTSPVQAARASIMVVWREEGGGGERKKATTGLARFGPKDRLGPCPPSLTRRSGAAARGTPQGP